MGFGVYNISASSSLVLSINRSLANMYRSIERLSSGSLLNSAYDGPADLVISQRLQTQIASLNQELENTTNLLGKYQTASSYVSELRYQLSELRSLAVSAANQGGNSEEAQQAYATAGNAIINTYNNLVVGAEYNGQKLLDGSESSLVNVTQLQGIDLSSAESAEATIEAIDSSLAGLDEAQIELASEERYSLDSERRSLENQIANLQAADSVLSDTDFVAEYANFLAQQFQLKASIALLGHYALTADSVMGLFASR